MRDYFTRRYSPANIVLAFAGKAEWGPLVELANAHCGAWQGSAASRVKRARSTARAHSRRSSAPTTSSRPSSASCDGPPLESPDRYAAHLLATILGDHTGSRLYWTLIDPGLADGAELSYQDYNQAGAFFSFLSCEPVETQANLDRIAEVYRTAIASGVTEEELIQAKNKVLARSVLRSERPMGRLASLGFHWMYRHAYISVEAGARGLQQGHAGRPAPTARRLAALAAHDRLGRTDDRSHGTRLTGLAVIGCWVAPNDPLVREAPTASPG